MKKEFSDFIIYVDESGDHGLKNIDSNYPVFVLAFCIFHKRYYSKSVVSQLEQFKFDHFGHDVVILHEHEIRKEKGIFNIFRSRQQREEFLDKLTTIIDESKFILAACVIEKDKERAWNNLNNYGAGFLLLTKRSQEAHSCSTQRLRSFRQGQKDKPECSSYFMHVPMLKSMGNDSDNPYHIALAFCLERVHQFLKEKGQNSRLTHIVVYSRGKTWKERG